MDAETIVGLVAASISLVLFTLKLINGMRHKVIDSVRPTPDHGPEGIRSKKDQRHLQPKCRTYQTLHRQETLSLCPNQDMCSCGITLQLEELPSTKHSKQRVLLTSPNSSAKIQEAVMISTQPKLTLFERLSLRLKQH